MSLRTIKLSNEVYEELKKIAEKSGKSIRELIEEAVNVYVLGKQQSDKDIKKITSKTIVNRFRTKCHKCGKELKEGEVVYYVKIEYEDGTKRSFVYCLDCYYESEALATHYMKKKQLEITIRGLKKKADKLVEKIEELKKRVDGYQLLDDIRRTNDLILQYIRYTGETEEKPRLEELMDKLDYLANKVTELLTALEIMEQPKVRTRTKVSIER